MFGLVPHLIRPDALCGSGGHFVNNVLEPEVGVDLLQQRGVVHALLQDLVFSAENVTIVLGKTAHAHDAVQATRRLVAVALSKLTVAQRQVPVALDALLENQNMPGAVHRLEGVFALLRLRGEHVLAVFFPMPGLLPQGFVNDLRTLDLLVPVVAVDLPHVLLNTLPQRPTLGMPKNQTWCVVINVEQVQLASQFAVIALFGLFNHGQVLLQLILAGPGRAINALQHLILVIAAPVSAREFHQLEEFKFAGARHVRAPAQVFKIAFAVERNIFVGRNAGNDLGLVVLAQALEIGHRLISWQYAACHRLIFGSQLYHFLFDGGQVFRGEGALVGKIVEKPMFNYRANRDLRLGEQGLNGISQ